MLIALIDDGIELAYINGLKLRHDLSVDKSGIIRERKSDEMILTNHGTTCAGIISKYAPDSEFCSLRIFHEEKLNANIIQLVAALEWCLAKKAPIIHMSVGSEYLGDYKIVRAIVAKIIQQRQIIIAAHSISGCYSIPACIGGVFGVISDKNMTDDEYEFVTGPKDIYSIKASSKHRLLLSSDREITTQITNSYAAPTVTAAVHRILTKRAPFTMTVAQVYAAVQKEKNIRYTQIIKPDFIEDANILNPYKYPILKQHLFFNCIGEYTTLQELPVSILNKHDLVYIAPCDSVATDLSYRLFELNENLFRGILYCGKLPLNNNLDLRNELTWSEDVYNDSLLQDDIIEEDIDCPIITIFGETSTSMNMLCKLRDMFLTNGYQCVGVSDNYFSYLYNIEYVSNTRYREYAISNINKTYMPDIIICSFQAKQRPTTKYTHSYYIEIGNRERVNSAPIGSLNQVNIHNILDNEAIVILYNEIINHFAG